MSSTGYSSGSSNSESKYIAQFEIELSGDDYRTWEDFQKQLTNSLKEELNKLPQMSNTGVQATSIRSRVFQVHEDTKSGAQS